MSEGPDAVPGRRALQDLLRPAGRALLGAAALQAIAAAASIVPFIALVEIARLLLEPTVDQGAVRQLVVVALVAFAVRLVAQGAAGQMTHLADNTFQRDVRRRLVAQLARAPLGWFGIRHSGEVKRAVQEDVSAMHYMVAHSLPDLVAGVVAPLVALIYLFSIDWVLALVALVPPGLFALLYLGIIRGYGGQMAEHAARLGRLEAAAVEFVHGIAVVKAFGASGRAHARYRDAAEAAVEHHDRWVRPIARRSAVAEAVCSPPLVLALLLGAGVARVAAGGIEPIDVAAFALLGLGLTAPLITLGYSAQGFRLAMDAAGRVSGLLAVAPLPQPSAAEAQTPAATADVTAGGVGFAYEPGRPALVDVAFHAAPGTVTALVGPSGAGKSTLAALIPRFWDVEAGSISTGGVDLRQLAEDDLYDRVAFVFQDPALLRLSVRDNIALADPAASQERVRAAAAAAQIDRRIEELPRGYDSVIGEDALLSGGEAQRVAIARALLADRPILVLDEATAFADPESEAEIQAALARLAEGRTLIVIAHRLATIAGADRILVLDDGRIVESGGHDDLVAAGGRYAALWAAHETVQGRPA